MNTKQGAIKVRQVAEMGAMDAITNLMHDASSASLDAIANYRRALVDVSFVTPELDHLAIVARFAADIGLSDNAQETIGEWKAWAVEFFDAIDARGQAQVELDGLHKSPGRGTMGHSLQVSSVAIARDDANEIIDRLKDGPVLGGEGVDFDDPNYVPWE